MEEGNDYKQKRARVDHGVCTTIAHIIFFFFGLCFFSDDMFKKKKYLKDVGGEKSKVEKKQSERQK